MATSSPPAASVRYFVDRYDFCKHVWAVILAADSEGYLLGGDPLHAESYLIAARSRAEKPEPPPEKQFHPPREPWQKFLQAVQQRESGQPQAYSSRYSQGEILYVVDGRATQGDVLPTIQVQHRIRKKNGEWGKATPAAILTTDIPHLPEADDRQILSLLLGAADAQMVGLQYVNVATRASFRIPEPLLERMLPLMAQSGRLLLRGFSNELTPLLWDGGPAWVFRLEVAVLADERLAVDGVLERAGETVPASALVLLLSPEFAIVGDSVVHLDHRGALSWLLELRRTGPTILPAKAAPDLIEAMARSHVEPHLLPESLRFDVVSTSPRPRIRMARASRPKGYGTREELDAAIEFDYGGTVLPARPEEGGYDRERRRIVRRLPSAEREALQLLESLGFHRPWYFDAKAGTLAIAVEKFPAAVRALVEAGWHVEAEGRVFRAAKSLEMQVKSGIDWFELHGGSTFGDGRWSLPDLLAALRRGEDLVPLGDGSFGLLPEEWLKKYVTLAGVGTPEGDHLRFRRTQVGLLDVLLAEQPEVRFDEPFERARAGCAVPGHCARGSRRRSRVSSAAISARPWLAPLPPRVRFRRLPGRRHGPGQDRPGARPAGGAPRLRAQERTPAAAVAGRGAAVARLQLEAGGRPLHAEAPRPRPYRHRPRQARGRVRRLRRHPDHLRHAAERYRRPQGLPVRLRHPRRGPGDQEREQPVGEGGPADPRRTAWPSAARRSRTTSASCGACSSSSTRAARQGRGDRQGRRRPPQAPARRAGRSWRRPSGRSSSGAPRSRSRRTCPRSPNRRSTATWNRPARAATTSCASTTGDSLLGAVATTGSGSRRSRSSRRCCACGRRPATPV